MTENLLKAKHLKHLKKSPKLALELKMGLDSLINQYIDDDPENWENEKIGFTYDENGLNTSLIQFDKDSASQEWIETAQTLYIYNDAGLLIEEIYNNPSESISMKFEYTMNF